MSEFRYIDAFHIRFNLAYQYHFILKCFPVLKIWQYCSVHKIMQHCLWIWSYDGPFNTEIAHSSDIYGDSDEVKHPLNISVPSDCRIHLTGGMFPRKQTQQKKICAHGHIVYNLRLVHVKSSLPCHHKSRWHSYPNEMLVPWLVLINLLQSNKFCYKSRTGHRTDMYRVSILVRYCNHRRGFPFL